MSTYADLAELASSELHNHDTTDFTTHPENPKTAVRNFFQKELIPEVKRAAIEINALQGTHRADWILYPNERFPESVELVIDPTCTKRENYISFRIEPDDFDGGGISWYTSDNPISRKISEPRLALVEDVILRFIGMAFRA
jgi:hypothetical protein